MNKKYHAGQPHKQIDQHLVTTLLEQKKFIDELREECTNSGVDPAAQEFQPALVLLFCDGKYIFTGVSRGPDL